MGGWGDEWMGIGVNEWMRICVDVYMSRNICIITLTHNPLTH